MPEVGITKILVDKGVEVVKAAAIVAIFGWFKFPLPAPNPMTTIITDCF